MDDAMDDVSDDAALEARLRPAATALIRDEGDAAGYLDAITAMAISMPPDRLRASMDYVLFPVTRVMRRESAPPTASSASDPSPSSEGAPRTLGARGDVVARSSRRSGASGRWFVARTRAAPPPPPPWTSSPSSSPSSRRARANATPTPSPSASPPLPPSATRSPPSIPPATDRAPLRPRPTRLRLRLLLLDVAHAEAIAGAQVPALSARTPSAPSATSCAPRKMTPTVWRFSSRGSCRASSAFAAPPARARDRDAARDQPRPRKIQPRPRRRRARSRGRHARSHARRFVRPANPRKFDEDGGEDGDEAGEDGGEAGETATRQAKTATRQAKTAMRQAKTATRQAKTATRQPPPPPPPLSHLRHLRSRSVFAVSSRDLAREIFIVHRTPTPGFRTVVFALTVVFAVFASRDARRKMGTVLIATRRLAFPAPNRVGSRPSRRTPNLPSSARRRARRRIASCSARVVERFAPRRDR